jgi:glycopeptide antibiotics resistance protein
VTTNILGFIPLGFFLAALLRQKSSLGRYPFIPVILCGLALSLAIELLHARLPTQDSQSMDVHTNLIGTSIGIAFFHIYDRSRAKDSIPGTRPRNL